MTYYYILMVSISVAIAAAMLAVWSIVQDTRPRTRLMKISTGLMWAALTGVLVVLAWGVKI